MTSRTISLSDKKVFAARLTPETVHLLLLVSVACSVILPMMFWGIPSANDLSNHFRFALPFYDALRSGHFYPGWLAESNNGFGDASFRFYPPALYYLLGLTRAAVGNWHAASLLSFAILSVLAAVGMYLWAREFTTSQTAMWAGIFYTLAPYHLNQLFQALMLAEFAGAAVLPFAFLFTERVCRHRRSKDVAGLAASYGLLVLTHLPLAVIGSIALACYALLRVERKNLWRTLSALGVSIALGLTASASYWMTMLFELKWIRADNVNPEPAVDYRLNFVLSTFSSDFLSVWWMNIVLLFTAAMFWPALILLTRVARRHYPKVHGQDADRIMAVALLLLLTLFMSTPLSRPVWNFFRPLQETQFPWRWLSIASMACPLLLALSLPLWMRLLRTRKRPFVILAAGTIVISLAFSVAHIIREARWLTPAQFEQTLNSIPGSPSVYQWLPVWVHGPLPKMTPAVAAGDRSIRVDDWAPQKRVFHVGAGDPVEARVKTFFYPYWTATAGGRLLSVHPDQDGVLRVTIPEEATEVTLEFREPARTRYAAGLMLMGWMAIGGCFLMGQPFFSKRAQNLIRRAGPPQSLPNLNY